MANQNVNYCQHYSYLLFKVLIRRFAINRCLCASRVLTITDQSATAQIRAAATRVKTTIANGLKVPVKTEASAEAENKNQAKT